MKSSSNADLTVGNKKFQNPPIIINGPVDCFILNRKNDASLFSLRNIKILQNMQNIFEILVQTALLMGGFWTIQKINPKSALLSLTMLIFGQKFPSLYPFLGNLTTDVTIILGTVKEYPIFMNGEECYE